jgi:hypothetical protein
LKRAKKLTTTRKELAMDRIGPTHQGTKQSADNATRLFHAIVANAKFSKLLTHINANAVAIGIAFALIAFSASAQTARDVKGATPLVAIQDEAPAKLIVDPPIPEQLALGRVFIQYRTENLRILPVFGKAALSVSPRVGHLHYFLDQQSWATVDTSGETVVFVGLPPGPHQVRLELADATHKPLPGTSKVVEFIVPSPKDAHN